MKEVKIELDPFPEITTERLRLRSVTDDDLSQIFRLRSDPQVMRYIGRPRAKTLEDAKAVMGIREEVMSSGTGINWGICQKEDPTLMGTMGFYQLEKEHFRITAGYSLLPEYHRKGYASEALCALLNYAFTEMNIHSIAAEVNPENKASIGLLEKHGFVREAYFRENFFFEGNFMDTAVYSLIKSKHQG